MSWLTGPSKPNPIITGYRYHIGMHMIVGHGNMDGTEKIRVGEKVVWTPSNILKESNTTILTSADADPQGWIAQTFIALSNYTLCSVSLLLYRPTNHHPGIITVSIRATDIDGHPTGQDLCIGTIDGETEITVNPPTLSAVEWKEIEFHTPILLTSGTKYAIVIRTTESATDDSVWWCGNIGGYSDGNGELTSDCGTTWIAHPSNIDFCFKTYQKDGTPPNRTIKINANEIFGGNKSEGGIYGNVDLMFGTPTQEQNSYLVNNLDADIPAFRGLMSFILNRVYIGTSPYLKYWSFFCKRVCKQISGDDQWYKEKAVIKPREEDGDDLNAIHIIRECLIDSEWGMGYSVDDIDDASFKEAANILYEENFGLSILWDQIESIEEFIDSILRMIAGFLYQDLKTGKWIISLTRDFDYNNPYDYNNTGDNNQGYRAGSNQRFAQTFTTSRNYICNKIKIKIYETVGAIVSNVRVELQSTDENGHPDGNVLAFGTISGNDISTTAAWVECIFKNEINLIANTKYALVIYPLGIKGLYWRVNTHSSFEGGHYLSSVDSGQTWTIVYTNDFMFEIYAGGNIETFNEDDIIDIEDYSRPTYGEIINQVTINWWDKIYEKSRPATVHDIALIEKQNGNIIELIYNYYGICNATLANQVAERELKLASSMLATMRIKATRKMSHLKPNDIFRLSWDDLDITQMIVRVLEIDYGNLNQNEIYLNCIEDVFSAAETIYGNAVDTLWTNPINDPIDITYRKLVEIPYWELCNNLENQSLVDAYKNNDIGFIGIAAVKPVLDAFDFKYYIKYKTGYNYIFEGWGTWCPSVTIVNSLSMNAKDVIIDIENEISLDFVIEGSYAIINNEIIKILSVDITNNQIEIARGILDTVPQAHSIGDRIYFVGSNYTPVQKEYTNGDQPKVKLLTRTANGILAEDDATEITANILNSRMIRPYPPGNLKFNEESYPIYFSTTATGKVAITWNHRDRKNATQLNSLVKHITAISYGPEVGATYTIKIYNKKNILKRTVTGLTGIAYNYTEAMEISDCGQLQGELRFVIYSVRNGYDSWQNYNIRLQRTCKGTVSSISNLSGNLSIEKECKGSIDSTTFLSTTLRNVTVLISGFVSSSTYLLSSLRGITILINGLITGISIVSGKSKLYRGLISSITGSSNVSGRFPEFILIVGSITGTSNVSGNINKELKLSGSSTGSSSISGDLFTAVILQDHYNINDDGASDDGEAAVYGDRWEAQTFTANKSYTLKSIKLYMSTDVDKTGKIVTASIRATAFGKPIESDLCFASIDAGDIAVEPGRTWIEFDFGAGIQLTNGTQYAIVLRSDEPTTQEIDWRVDNTSPSYAGGTRCNSNNAGANWFDPITGHDFLFETYGS